MGMNDRLIDVLPDFAHDALDRRDRVVFEQIRCRQRDMRRRNTVYRAVEIPETFFGSDGGDFRAPAAQTRIFLDRHQASGLRDFRQYGLRVERHQRTHVDHRRRYAVFLFQNRRGIERTVHHQRQSDDGDILALTQHLGFAQLIDVFAVGFKR